MCQHQNIKGKMKYESLMDKRAVSSH